MGTFIYREHIPDSLEFHSSDGGGDLFTADPHVVMPRDVKKLCFNFVSIGVASAGEELEEGPKKRL